MQTFLFYEIIQTNEFETCIIDNENQIIFFYADDELIHRQMFEFIV